MPSAIRHDSEFHSQGLITILVECQGADDRALAAFLWKTFPENRCYTCTGTNVPIPPSRGIPNGALVGVDGTILWAGNPNAGGKQMEQLLATELEKVKKGWGDTPEAKKVRALLYGKKDLAGAMAAVESIQDADKRAALQKEVENRHASDVKAVEELKRQGQYLKAQDRAQALLRSVGARADWMGAAKQLVADFETPEAKEMLAFDKKVEKVEKQLRDKKGDAAQKALASMLKGGSETAVSGRAKALLEALQTKVE